MTKHPKTCDMDLRLLVTRALLESGVPRDAIRHEITLDSSSSDGRADIVVALDRELIGIEIKSGKDKLDRLETQRDQYRRRFDKLCLVVDERHVPQGDYHAAANWAYRLDFGSVSTVIRGQEGLPAFSDRDFVCPSTPPWQPSRIWENRCGPSNKMSPHAMLDMLWASEALEVAAKLVGAGRVPPTVEGQRYRVIPHLAEHASIGLLRPLIAQALRSRQLNKWEEGFWSVFDAGEAGAAA